MSHSIIVLRGVPGGSEVKNLPANVGDVGLIPGWKDPLEEEMATHSRYSCWENPRVPWTMEEYSPLGPKESAGHD